MSDRAFLIFGMVIIIVTMCIGLVIAAAIWEECRGAGHSVLYCLKVVSR